MIKKIGLDSMNDDVIRRIMDFMAVEDRKALSLVNRNFCRLYLSKREFVYILQGHTGNMFYHGLKILLDSKRRYKKLFVAHFDLEDNFDKQFPSNDDIFGKNSDDLIKGSITCHSIVHITFEDCIVSDIALYRFIRLFPEIWKLTFHRCTFLSTCTLKEYQSDLEPKKTKLSVMEFLSPAPVDKKITICRIMELLWTSEQRGRGEISFYEVNALSRKRPVMKRFQRKLNERMLRSQEANKFMSEDVDAVSDKKTKSGDSQMKPVEIVFFTNEDFVTATSCFDIRMIRTS